MFEKLWRSIKCFFCPEILRYEFRIETLDEEISILRESDYKKQRTINTLLEELELKNTELIDNEKITKDLRDKVVTLEQAITSLEKANHELEQKLSQEQAASSFLKILEEFSKQSIKPTPPIFPQTQPIHPQFPIGPEILPFQPLPDYTIYPKIWCHMDKDTDSLPIMSDKINPEISAQLNQIPKQTFP